MSTSTISYLGTPGRPVPPPTLVDTPIEVRIGWGDRRTNPTACLSVWHVTADGRELVSAKPGVVRCTRDRYPAECSAEEAAALIESQRLVAAALDAAYRDRADVRETCDAYYAIVADIHRQGIDHEHRMSAMLADVARRLRRRRVVLGPPEVPYTYPVYSVRRTRLATLHMREDGSIAQLAVRQ